VCAACSLVANVSKMSYFVEIQLFSHSAVLTLTTPWVSIVVSQASRDSLHKSHLVAKVW